MNGRSLMVYGGLFLMFGLGMIAREAVVRLQARNRHRRSGSDTNMPPPRSKRH